jgi:hypothetical protein
MRKSISICVSVSAVLVMLSAPARADDDGWQHTAAIYMIGASIDGTVGIGPVNGDLDIGFDDILDNFDGAFMGAYRGDAGRWAVSADVIYFGLEKKQSGLGIAGNESGQVNIDQLIFEVDGNYQLTEHLDAVAGLRYWDLDTKLKRTFPQPAPTLTGKVQEDWIDPLVGLRYEQPLGDRWVFVGRGDIGGFGVGSDFSWHVTAFFGLKVFKSGMVLAGVRYLGVDYEDGDGVDRFKFDVTEGGPTLGFAWTF